MAPTTAPARPAASRRDAEQFERDLLASLGLGADATSEEVEEAHDRLLAFLEGAPHDLETWARDRMAAADEAYALLSDPGALSLAMEARVAAPVPTAPVPASVGGRSDGARVRVSPGADAQARRARPAPVAADAREIEPDDDLPDELFESEGAGMPVRRPQRLARRAAPVAREAAMPGRTATPLARALGNRVIRRLALGGAVAAVAVAVALGVYGAGAQTVPGISGTPAPETTDNGIIDRSRVDALMQKIQANPSDVAALTELGNIYFDAGDYRTAAVFMGKVLVIEPDNVAALVGLGAAEFNSGDPAAARIQWEKALSIDPRNQEAHYDLGFLYLNQSPPDMDNVRLHWNRVMEIDAESPLAKSVRTHLDAFASAPPAPPAGTPSASPAAGE